MVKENKTSKKTSNTNPNNPVPNSIPFTKDNQPSSKAKKKGWALRRAKEKIKESFTKFSLYSFDDLKKLANKFKKGDYTDLDGKTKLLVAEVKAIKYILNNKWDVDFMNRGLPYEKTEMDLTSNGESMNSNTTVIFKDGTKD